MHLGSAGSGRPQTFMPAGNAPSLALPGWCLGPAVRQWRGQWVLGSAAAAPCPSCCRPEPILSPFSCPVPSPMHWPAGAGGGGGPGHPLLGRRARLHGLIQFPPWQAGEATAGPARCLYSKCPSPARGSSQRPQQPGTNYPRMAETWVGGGWLQAFPTWALALALSALPAGTSMAKGVCRAQPGIPLSSVQHPSSRDALHWPVPVSPKSTSDSCCYLPSILGSS